MRKISIYIDIFFCLIVLPVMIIIFPVERWYHNFQWYVVSVGVWLYFSYVLNRSVTVPLLFQDRKRQIAGVLIVLLSFAVTYGLSGITLYPPAHSIHDDGIGRLLPNIQQYQQAVWSLFMIVETFSFAVGLLTQADRQRSRRLEVEAERDKAEIRLFKAQIKPHFMFNTLNSLYGMFLVGDENALASLERFISMIRYIYTTSMRDMVCLSEEVDYVEQYVELQKLRLNEMTEVKFDVSVENESLKIPPMLVMTFIENCFKYGISSDERSEIRISLHESSGRLDFTTVNRVFPTVRSGGHTGIENSRRRLELLYPGKHGLSVTNDGEHFKVRLYILLK